MMNQISLSILNNTKIHTSTVFFPVFSTKKNPIPWQGTETLKYKTERESQMDMTKLRGSTKPIMDQQ